MGNSVDADPGVAVGHATSTTIRQPELITVQTAPQSLQNVPPEAIDRWLKKRIKCRKLCDELNGLPVLDYFPGITLDYVRANPPEKLTILSELFNITCEQASKLLILPTFRCDEGSNIVFKGRCSFNWDCVILDNAKVIIGDQVLIGPGVHIYTAGHSLDPIVRVTSPAVAHCVTIGDQVWIGGNSTIIGPCTLGNRVVVAAGSVVKGTWPDDVVIGGNPARVIKHLKGKEQKNLLTTQSAPACFTQLDFERTLNNFSKLFIILREEIYV